MRIGGSGLFYEVNSSSAVLLALALQQPEGVVSDTSKSGMETKMRRGGEVLEAIKLFCGCSVSTVP